MQTAMHDASEASGLAGALEPGVIPRSVQGSLLGRRQAPISMRFCTRLPASQFTFFSWLGPTCGTSHCQGLFLDEFHGWMMLVCPPVRMVNVDQL
jgi:hypothetical protein